MTDDAKLLHRYAEEKSETAFAELVRRHVNFVYACALRRVGGDTHLAEDVTQQVFTAAARGAAALARREVLSGWLYTTARNAAAQVVRTERRRQARETEAQIMNELTSSSARDAEWERLRPVLDDALDDLGDSDREAVLLRFFEGKDFAQVGKILNVSDNAARMRVERALDKMHAALGRRGVTSTTAALALALANQAGVAAPAGLAASVTGAAMAGAAGGGGLAAAVTFMSITKLQIGIAGALALAVGAGYFVQTETNAGLRRELAVVRGQQQAVAALHAENQQLAKAAAEVEMLRRDDVELKRLEQSVVEVKKQNAENARLAAARAQQDRRSELEEQLREADRKAQLEVDRMNREGNALVMEYKTLFERLKDASLTAEARAQADAAAKAKLEEIKAKKNEITAFVDNTRRALSQRAAELGVSPPAQPDSVKRTPSGGQWTLGTAAGTIELRRAPPSASDAPMNPPTPAGTDKSVPRP